MSDQTHFLQRTARLEDAALQRAMTIYREPAARQCLLRIARERGLPKDARVAVPLGPQASPAHVVLNAEEDVVTCLAEGMVVGDSMALPWAQVEEVLRAHLSADPDPYWTWRRLMDALVNADGWLPREAYQILLQERLATSHILPLLFHEAVHDFIAVRKRWAGVLHGPVNRQPKEFRESMGPILWTLRYAEDLAGDLKVEKLQPKLLILIHSAYAHLDVSAAVALGRMGPKAFEEMVRKFHSLKGRENIFERADLVRAIAIGAARQPSLAAETGRFLKRVLEGRGDPDRVAEDFVAMRTAYLALWYLCAQGGRVGADVVSTFDGRPDPELVRSHGYVWRDLCTELHARWPPGDWQPIDSCLPRVDSEAGHKKGVRPLEEPMQESRPAGLEREEAKVRRNDPCRCGSGKKAKKCCGTQAKYVEKVTRLDHPYDLEEAAYRRAMDVFQRIRERAGAGKEGQPR